MSSQELAPAAPPEEHLRTALLAGEVGAWTLEEGSDRVHVDAGLRRLFGLPHARAALTRAELLALVHDEDRDSLAGVLDRAWSEGAPFVLEFRIRTRVPEQRVVCRGMVLGDPPGPRRLLGVTYDLTALQHLEQALEAGRKALAERVLHLEGVLDNAPAGLALFEAAPPYRVLAHNQIYQAFLDEPWRTRGVVGRAPEEYAPDVAESGILQLFRQVAESGEGMVVQDFVYDGLERGRTWWDWSLSPVKEDGRVVRLANMVIETTQAVQDRAELEEQILERQRAEHALARHARQQEAVARLGELALRSRDLDEVLTQAAELAAELLGFERAAVLQVDGEALVPAATAGWPEETLASLAIRLTEGSPASLCLRSDMPVVSRNVQADPRFECPPELVEAGTHTVLACPVHLGGGATWGVVAAHCSRIQDLAGDDISFVASLATIVGQAVERERSEQRLARRERQLRLALEAGGMGIWTRTEDEVMVRGDGHHRALWGFDDEGPTVHVSRYRERIHPEDRERLFDGRPPDVMPEGDSYEAEFRIVLDSGEVRWLSASGIVEQSDGDRTRRLVGVNRDITSRKRSEAALRDSARRLEQAKEAAGLGIFEFDLATGSLHWDDWVYRRWGIEPGTPVTYEDFLAGVHPDDRAATQAQVDAAFSPDGDGHYYTEFRSPHPETGEERWIAGSGRVFFEGGRPSRMVGTCQDITEQKQYEAALTRAKQDLEQRVAERTIELKRRADQLARLSSELTLAEQRERRRLATVLHDHLQQILVGAKLRLTVLRRKVDPDEADAVDLVAGLVDDAIEASRSLTVQLSPPILHEAGLTAGLEWLARWMQDTHGLAVRLDLEEGVQLPREDVRLLVFESVRELLFNVVKHAGVSEALVRARLEEGPQGRRLVVAIVDRGAGFELAEVESRQSGKLGGGFGLFSIRERLDLMGGSFEIDSAPGEGSCFTLVAPLHEEDPTGPLDQPATPAEPEPPAASEADPPSIRVLLVDDHEVVRMGLFMLLSAESDLEIVGEAGDGLEAVSMVDALRPDVVLLDYSLPGLDGVEACRRITREHPEVRVIGLSMYSASERAAAMVEAGAAAYLTKGDDTAPLLEAIRSSATSRPAT